MNVVKCGIAAIVLVAAWSGRGEAAPTPEQRADLTPTAREMSNQGLRQYQQGEYDAAIESFVSAFALSNNAGLLFNVAQAYRLKGDCARAKDHYQRYLDAAPETALKPSVARRLTEMDACLKASKTPSSAPSSEPAASIILAAKVSAPEAARLEVRSASREPSPEPTARRRTLAWTLRGSAAALLVTSAVFGGLAWRAYRDYEGTSEQVAASEANDRFKLETLSSWIFATSAPACAVASYFVGRNL